MVHGGVNQEKNGPKARKASRDEPVCAQGREPKGDADTEIVEEEIANQPDACHGRTSSQGRRRGGESRAGACHRGQTTGEGEDKKTEANRMARSGRRKGETSM